MAKLGDFAAEDNDSHDNIQEIFAIGEIT